MRELITVPFRGDTLFALREQGHVFVAIKPIVQALGLDWRAQHRRLSDDPILSRGMVMAAIPSVGGEQETTCLRLELVNGWLFTIDAARCREEVRDRVLAYKAECFEVLFRHFYQGQPAAAVIEQECEPIRLRMVTEARHVFGVQAAAELWFRLKLPEVPAMRRDPGQGVLPV